MASQEHQYEETPESSGINNKHRPLFTGQHKVEQERRAPQAAPGTPVIDYRS